MRDWRIWTGTAVVLSVGMALPGWAAFPRVQAAPVHPVAGVRARGIGLPAHRVAQITLKGTLLEYPRGFNFSLFHFGPSHQPALTSLIHTLGKAAQDRGIAGVYLNLQSFDLSLTQAQELGRRLDRLRRAGKQVAVFSEDYDTNTYLLACHANTILMARHGTLFLPGVELQLMFFKGLLDKLHLQADMVQIGKFKGAEEPFTRTSASKAFAGQVRQLVGAWYQQISATIAAHRHLTQAQVAAAINQGWMPGTAAQKRGLVDVLTTGRQTVTPWLEKHFAGGCVVVHNLVTPTRATVNLNSPFALFQLLNSGPARPGGLRPAIAVICATGVIADDFPGAAEADGIITPARIGREVAAAVKNPRVKAIVLRVNSPGGSAEASEEIWQILRAAGRKKPLTVSLGSEAASGGYYIATAGSQITADPGTITGSIGVVGGKLVLGGLFKEIGLHVETFSQGQNAGLFDGITAFTPPQRVFVRHLMRRTYRLFTRRVMESRGKKIANIQAVARGRLFAGTAAVKAGLVDRIGSLAAVIRRAARTAHIVGRYQVLIFPRAKTLAEMIREKFGIKAELPLQLGPLWSGLSPAARRGALEGLQMLRVLQRDEVILAAPVGWMKP